MKRTIPDAGAASVALGQTKRLLFYLLALLLTFPAPGLGATIHVTLDGKSPGRIFEGIGMVNSSGTSKLLQDYPPAQRQDILDLLFKPRFGASLSVVKNEIGADVNSSTGTEPCHQRLEMEQPTIRGVNFLICREAKTRYSLMRFAAGRWGIPAWAAVSPEKKRDYYLSYLKVMAENGTPLNDLSPEENEGAFDRDYVLKVLKPALQAPELRPLRLVAKDEVQGWNIVKAFDKDRELKDALSALSSHYTTQSTREAKDCGLPLYNDECDTPMRGNWKRLMFVARNLARQYVDGRMVRALYQPALDGVYEAVKYNYKGILTAVTPWSGHYEVHPSLWMTAHFTQFAEPGWRFLDKACGSLDPENYHLSLRNPATQDYSVILVNGGDQDVEYQFKVTGGLPAVPLHVWRTGKSEQFIQQQDITPVKRNFSVTVPAQSIVSLTTTTGQRKGEPAQPIPSDMSIPLPYRDDFSSYKPGEQPRYALDQAGAFEAGRIAGRPCIMQVVTDPPIDWWNGKSKRNPYTVLGDPRWVNVEVGVDVLLQDGNEAYVSGRGNLHDRDGNVPATGYQIVLRKDGGWTFRKVVFGEATKLATGKLPVFDPGKWHNLKVRMKGTSISAHIDGKRVAQAKDGDLSSGQAALGCDFGNVSFGDLSIEPLDAVTPASCTFTDNRNPYISYSDSWEDEDGNWMDYARSSRKAKTAGSSLTYLFKGTGVCLLGRRDKGCGRADVYLDGEKAATIDTYRPKPLHRSPLFFKDGLGPGRHTLKLVVTGVKDPAATDTYVYMDGIEHLGP